MKKKTRFVLLGLLRDETMSGYDIRNCINTRMSFFWQESYGQIYPELNEMLKEGLIVESSEELQADVRGKIKYTITEKGKEVFCEWMAATNEKDTVRSEALLKFFLADDKNKLDVENHLEDFHQQNKEKLDLYLRFTDNLKQFGDTHNNHKYILKMLELGIKQQEVNCEWSKEYMKELKGGAIE